MMETILVERSKERAKIENGIKQLPWYKASTMAMQQKLLSLPENANGFLKDILQHPIKGGGVMILNLEELLFSPFENIFSITPIFRVQVIKNPEIIYAYEFHSWKQGPESGSKGVILLENESGKITYIVCLRGFKFAVGKEAFDIPGGFAKSDEIGIAGMIKRFDKEIREELGTPDVQLKRIIPLGRLQVDAGLTNNWPNIFAAVIDGSKINLREEEETKNPDPFEMRTSVIVTPIDRIDEFVEENDDAYFLACIARLKARREI